EFYGYRHSTCCPLLESSRTSGHADARRAALFLESRNSFEKESRQKKGCGQRFMFSVHILNAGIAENRRKLLPQEKLIIPKLKKSANFKGKLGKLHEGRTAFCQYGDGGVDEADGIGSAIPKCLNRAKNIRKSFCECLTGFSRATFFLVGS